MKCPNCKEPTLVIAERKGIEIDHCPECRGIWLDRGELDKILEKSREEEIRLRPEAAPQISHQPAYRPDHRSDYRSDHYQKPYKRKKSFLEELFD